MGQVNRFALARTSGDPIGVPHEDIVQGDEGDGFGGRLDGIEGAAHGAIDHAGDRFEQGLGRQVDRAARGAQGVASETALTTAKWLGGGLAAVVLVALAVRAARDAGGRSPEPLS